MVSAFALGLRQSVDPKEIFPGGEFFIVANFSGLDIAFKGFLGSGSRSLAGEERRGQAHTGQKHERYARAFLNGGRVHTGNMRKRLRISNGLRVNRDR